MEAPRRVLVANRGEIAVRIIRAAHALGWEAAAVYSDADEDALWVHLADAAVHIGPSPAAKSYLNPEAIVAAAREAGAQFVHPGYGFLAERAGFARLLAEEGLTFVGPPARVIEEMGDKSRARRTAEAAGVPIVPGTATLAGLAEAEEAAGELGFPLLVKAAAGGGGRGIRFVEDLPGLRQVVAVAQAEAQSAFGDPSLYLERALVGARHLEVQILGDTHGNVIHLYERDCSVQRRRQKLLEEAPAPQLPAHQREAMTAAAVRLAEAVGYVGAGTVEFVAAGEEFYFIEMNTRVQVEHPITEEITGVDIVTEQLRIAAGEPLSYTQGEIRPAGAAIQFRINAEDPGRDFFPSPGEVTRFDTPGGIGTRVDAGVVAGGQVAPYYDSLIAKVIASGRDREEALARAAQALTELRIEGVATTRDVHLALLADPAFRAGGVSTTWLEESWLPSWPGPG